MVNYDCPRCGYSINIKKKYINHLNRKKICNNIISNDDLTNEYIKFSITNKISLSDINNTCKNDNKNKIFNNFELNNLDDEPKMSQNEPKMPQYHKNNKKSDNFSDIILEKKNSCINNVKSKNNNIKYSITKDDEPKMSQNEPFLAQDEGIKYLCEYCNKEYSHVQSLNKHKKRCNEKIKVDEANTYMLELVNILNKQLEDQRLYFEKKELEQRKEIEKKELEQKREFKLELEKKEKEFKIELEKRNKQIDELIKKSGINNSKITQNIQNNIKLLSYKETDISKISENDIIKCINHNNMCVPELIKMIHLDPKKPENHNVFISNLKNGYIMVYDGNKWDTLNRDDTIKDMIEDKQNIIEEKIEVWITKGKQYPELMKKFKRYLNKKENNEVLNRIKEEVKLMLYNNRNVIENCEI